MTDSPSDAAGRIFISYRRQDSAYPAGWLYDRLAERFGPGQVFKDVDSIELGDDFVETITNAVGSCDILLALIGQDWLDIAGPDGSRRLDDPDDFVRLEIEAALQRKVLLIPILVEGALMPRGDELPPSIAPLVRRQALELSPNRFRADTDRLLEVIERTLVDLQQEHAEDAPEAPAPEPSPPKTAIETTETTESRSKLSPFSTTRVRVALAAASVAAIAALIWLLLPEDPDDKDSVIEDSPPPTSTATKPPKLGGAGAPVVLAHRGGDEMFAWQTLPAFEHAAKLGAAIETDVRWTKDGVAVLAHDPNTTPGMVCSGGPHEIKDTNWPVLRDECRSPSRGGKQYGIPTFDQAVSTVAKIPEAEVYPEVKVAQGPRQVRQFVTILQSVRMTGRAVVTSALPDELAKIQAQAQKEGVDDLRLMQFVSKKRVPVANLADDLWGVAVEEDVATKAYADALHDADLKVMVWNINKPAQWEEADRIGADIVMTDKPEAYGKWAKLN